LPSHSFYFNPKYKFPESVKIEEIYHGRTEQWSDNKKNAYCHVIPNGLVQEVFVHLEKTIDEDTKEKKEKKTFKMIPFFGKFEMLDGFVKPQR